MSKLDDVINKLNKDFKTDIITTDMNDSTFSVRERVDLEHSVFTYMLHGGLPTHILCEASGESSGGKTSFCMFVAGKFQKHYKNKWEKEVEALQAIEKPNKTQKAQLEDLLNRGYKKVVWLDSEHSLTDETWCAKNGLDISDIIYIKPQQESAEQLLDATLALIESDGVCLVIIDSIAALTSGAALEKKLFEKTYCGISAPLTTWTSKVLPLLNKYDCTVICVNQERDVINSTFPAKRTPGGASFKYGCHYRIAFRKGKPIDENYNEIPAKEESYYGQMSEIQVLKNKIVKPDRRLGRITIAFDKGIYALNDCLNMAVSLGLITKAGAWFSIQDENGDTIVHDNGDTMKWQGMANLIRYMEQHEDVYKEVYDKVCEVVEADS